ncbi:MAG: RluA family pseudouridine synthase [Oscillospiraceae bacterium]|jgi:23S rRNA pseudouridine955/2504/2580 synthase|nr:RluA family pseudouridine synthase [Oscillospiraceae bacterium]
MKQFVITKNDADQRLDKFLTKAVPLLPQSLLYKYIRTKRIKVNRGRAEISTRLQTGDVVELYINDEFFAPAAVKHDFLGASSTIDAVYEDENILLLNKPAGLLSHPDEGEYVDTLITRVKRYLFEKGEYHPEDSASFAPALANRIDRNTAGIVIAAKNAEALRILNEKIKSREIHKRYLCVVHGRMEKKEDTLHGWLFKDEAKNKVFVFQARREGSREIKTKYSVLAEKNNLSLLEVDLLTGRTHQIRAHLAAIGHPLLGDGKYGTNVQNRQWGYKKQFLCSYKLLFDFASDSGPLAYLDKREFALEAVWFRDEFFALEPGRDSGAKNTALAGKQGRHKQKSGGNARQSATAVRRKLP